MEIFCKHLQDLNLLPGEAKGRTDLDVWSIVPYFDGNSLRKEFKISGAKIGDMIQKQIERKIEFPEETIDECLEWLKKEENIKK